MTTRAGPGKESHDKSRALNRVRVLNFKMATMNDQDPKRKRAAFTAFEKAKATHVSLSACAIYLSNNPQLSRQLHLRLQYAKLKVEHGWVSTETPP